MESKTPLFGSLQSTPLTGTCLLTCHPNCVDIVHFGAHTSHSFVLPQNTQQWGKRPLHIKGKSFLINTFSGASLDDVGFYEMQDLPFWVTTIHP